jgi:hypothetical protein
MLHVTNGDIVRGVLEEAGLPGEVTPWRDVLHEGPAPAGLSLAELRALRGRFVAERGWSSHAEALAGFERRDLALASERHEVVLWFEADLYDQLQLVQVLERLDRFSAPASLVSVASFAGLEPAPARALYAARRGVTDAQRELGRRAWHAFCSPDPTAIEELAAADTAALPELRSALRRHLEQFPSLENGLARTERQILEAVAAGASLASEIFCVQQAKEERPFMGDSTLFGYIDRLAGGAAPLLARANGQTRMTEAGWDVLAGRDDFVRLNGIDRWLGGVHLEGREAVWRWDSDAAVLSRPA